MIGGVLPGNRLQEVDEDVQGGPHQDAGGQDTDPSLRRQSTSGICPYARRDVQFTIPHLHSERLDKTVCLGEVLGRPHQDGVDVGTEKGTVVHYMQSFLKDIEVTRSNIDFLW